MKVNLSKRILSLLLALMMVLGMLPASPIHVHATEHEDEIVVGKTTMPTTQPEEEAAVEEKPLVKENTIVVQDTAELAVTTYDVYVNGVGMANGTYLANNAKATRPDKPSVGHAYYKDGVLTLNYYNCRGTGYEIGNNSQTLIYAARNLTINLNGENTLTQTTENNLGIYFAEGGTIGGSGSLAISGPCTYGIHVETGDFTCYADYVSILDCKHGVDVKTGDIWIGGGSLDIIAQGHAISARKGSVTVTDGELTAKSTNGSDSNRAIHAANGFSVANHLTVLAAEAYDGVPGAYDAANIKNYDLIMVKNYPILLGVKTTGGMVGESESGGSIYFDSCDGVFNKTCSEETTWTVSRLRTASGQLNSMPVVGETYYFDITVQGENINFSGVSAMNCDVKLDYYDVAFVESAYTDTSATITFSATRRQTYDVLFYFRGDEYPIAGYTVEPGQTVEPIDDPYRDGMHFLGWFTEDGQLYDFDASVTKNINLYAKFGHYVMFYLGESPVASQDIEDGKTATEIEGPTQEGYVFKGWYTEDGQPYDFATPVKADLNLYAKFTKIHTVSFYTGGADPVSTQNIEDGKTATKPEDPYQDGKKFLGWYTEDDQPYDFSTPVTGDLNLHAKFVKTHTVTLMFGDSAVGWLTAEDGKPVVKPEDPAQEGKIFVGWYTEDGKPYDFTKPVTQDLRLYATFTQVAVDGVPLVDGWYLPSGSTTPTKTKPSGGYAYYKDGTLTLNSYTNTGAGYTYTTDNSAAIYASADLSVILAGSGNTISCTSGSGIVAEGDLTITGSTAFTVSGSATAVKAENFTADITTGSVTIVSDTYSTLYVLGTIKVTAENILIESKASGGSGSNTIVSSGNVTLTADENITVKSAANWAISSKSFKATVTNGDFITNGYINCNSGVNIKAKGDVTVTNGWVGVNENTADSSIVSDTGSVTIVSNTYNTLNVLGAIAVSAENILIESKASGGSGTNTIVSSGNVTLTADENITVKSAANWAISSKSFKATVTNGDFITNGYINCNSGVDIKAKGDVTVTNGYVSDNESTAVSSIVSETGKVSITSQDNSALIPRGTLAVTAATTIYLKSGPETGANTISGNGHVTLTAPDGITIHSPMNYAVFGKSFTATVTDGDFVANGYIVGRNGVNIKAKGDVIVTNGYVGDTESTAVSSIVSETGSVKLSSTTNTLTPNGVIDITAADSIEIKSTNTSGTTMIAGSGSLKLTAPNGITLDTTSGYAMSLGGDFTAKVANGAFSTEGMNSANTLNIEAYGDVTVEGPNGYFAASGTDGTNRIESKTGDVKINGTTYALRVNGTMDIVAANIIEIKSIDTSGTTMIAGSGSLNLTAPNGITLDTTSGYGMSLSGDFTAKVANGAFNTKGANSARSLNIEAKGDVTVDGPNGYLYAGSSTGTSRIESKTGSVKVNGTTYALLMNGTMDIVAADSIEIKSTNTSGTTMIAGSGSLNLTAPNGITLDTTSGYAMSLGGDFTATTSKGSFSTKGMNVANTLNIEAYGDLTVEGPNGYFAASGTDGTNRIESKTGDVKINGTTYALRVNGTMDIVAANIIEIKSIDTSGATMIAGSGSLNLTAPNGIMLDTTSGYGMSLSGDFTAKVANGTFSTKGGNGARSLNIEAKGDITLSGKNAYWSAFGSEYSSSVVSTEGTITVTTMDDDYGTAIMGSGDFLMSAPKGIAINCANPYAVSVSGDFTAKTTGGAFTAKGYFYCKNIDIDAYGDVTITSYISLESEDDGTGRIVSRNGKIDVSIPEEYEAVIYRGNWTFESKNGTTLTANSALNPERGVFYDALTLDVTGPLKLVNTGGGYVLLNDLTIKGEEVTMIGAPAGLSNAVITYENRNGKAYAVYEGASEATLTAADHEASGEIYSGYLDANVVKFAEAANVSTKNVAKLELELAGFDTDNLANSVTGKVTSTGAALRSGGYERGFLVLTDEEGTPAVFLRDDRMSANTAYWVRFQIRAADGYSLKNLTAADVTLKGYTGVTPVLTYNEATEVLIVDFLMPKLKPVVYVGGVKLHSGEYLDESGKTHTTALTNNYAYYKDGVLTLHNYDYSGAGYEFVTGYSAAIYSQYDLEIVLDAATANTLEATGKYGICVNNRVDRTVKTTIRGTGTLEIDAAGDGVYAYGDLTVNNADLTINSGNYALNVSGTADIDNSSLTIDADNFGIYAMTSIDISNAASDQVDIISGTYPVYANNYSVTLSGGKYNLKSVDLEEGVLHHSLFAGKDVSISNADVVIEGAVNGIYTYGTVELQNSTVKITADAQGISGTGAVSVNGGSLDITSDSFGVISDGDITIQDAELDITADGGAIVSHKDVTIVLIDCDATINGNSFALNAYYGKIYMENTDATFNTAYGILANEVELKGTPDTIVKINSTKEYGIYSKTDIVIAGGTWNVSTLGYDAIGAPNGVTITDAVVTAVGASNGISQYYGDIEIYNSYVTAKSTATSNDSAYSAIKLYNSGKLIIGDGLIGKASTEPDGTLGAYDAAKLSDYDYITITPPCIHKWDSGVITTQPGCETEGVKTYTCKNGCGDTYTETIASLWHNWNEINICTRCGVKRNHEIEPFDMAFTSLTPAVTEAQLAAGEATITSNEAINFQFTYEPLPGWMRDEGYSLGFGIVVYRDGVWVENSEGTEHTLNKIGQYDVILRQRLVNKNGETIELKDFTYHVTIESPYALAFTSVTPSVTDAQLSSGEAAITVSGPTTFEFAYAPLPQWMTNGGYKIVCEVMAYQDGVIKTGEKDNSLELATFGEFDIVLRQTLLDYNNQQLDQLEFTYHTTFENSYELKFKTMTPSVTAADLAAGKTELGVIPSGTKFGFTFEAPPEWITDGSTNYAGQVEAIVYDYMDGVLVNEVWGHPGANAVEYECLAGGDHVIVMELRLVNIWNQKIDSITHTYNCTIIASPATGIEINKDNLLMSVGDTETLNAEITPAAADPEVLWSSDNTAVATVDGTGKVTAVAPGTAIITATDVNGFVSDTCIVSVSGGSIYVDGVALEPGQYLAQGAKLATTTKPTDNYVYYGKNSDGDMQLTLHNYTHTGSGYWADFDGSVSCMAIYAPEFVVLKLEGISSIAMDSSDWTYGVYLASGSEVIGDGTLDIQNAMYGIYGESGLSFESGSITVDAAEYGIFADGSVTFCGADVDVKATTSALEYMSGDCQITAGDLSFYAANGRAISTTSGDLTISGGSVSVVSDSQLDARSAIYNYNGIVTVSGGALYAEAYNAAILITGDDGKLTVTGGELLAKSDTRAINISGTFTYDSALKAIGSTKSDGSDPESLDAAKVDTYKYVYIGEPTAPTGQKGDVNLDGEVDMADLVMLARHVGEVEYLEDTVLANADVTGDGNVDMADLVMVARYVGEIITSWDQE